MYTIIAGSVQNIRKVIELLQKYFKKEKKVGRVG